MTQIEAICWAFDEVPSRFPILEWKYSFRDIETKLKLRLGETQAKIAQDYEVLATILSQAFGGGSNKPKVPETADEAMAQFKAVFGQ